jgi:hypothetical protein
MFMEMVQRRKEEAERRINEDKVGTQGKGSALHVHH